MKPCFIRYIIMALLISAISVSAYAELNVVNGAPEGFEKLEEPRQTVVTIEYGGQILGQFAARFTPNAIIINDPAKLAEAVPNLLQKEDVIKALGGTLPAHAAEICRNQSRTNCGHLVPDVAGITFDEQSLSAELFINPNYISISDNSGPRYLPLPERNISSVYGFTGAVAGSNITTTNFALNNSAIYSYGEARLNTQTSINNDGLRFDEAAASIDRRGWEATAGLFRSRGMQLISDSDMGGVSVSTSTRTRLDRHKTEGNDIILYLPRRAIVSIYREGRIYSSRTYDAGNQTIDTSEMPEGAYNIALKIQELDGSTREETRFLAKSQDIPPSDNPTYYAQAGVIRKPAALDSTIPQLTSKPLLRAGTVRRIADNIGLDTSLLGLADRVAAETGAFMIYGGMQIRVGGLVSTRGDTGLQMSYQHTLEKWNLGFDARKIWSDDPLQDQIDPVIAGLEQATTNISYNVTPDLTLGLRGSYTSQNRVINRSYGPTLQWYIWREGESMLNFTADAGESNNQPAANAFLRFSMRFGHYTASGDAGFTKNADNNGLSSDARLSYDNITPETSLQLGATVQKTPDAKTIGGDADWRDSNGRVHGLLQQSWATEGQVLSYGGSYAFNAAQSEDKIQFGGNRMDNSAIIITSRGDAKVPMKIMVNGSESGIVRPGSQEAIYLSPYESYDIKLVPTESAMLDYDNSAKHVILYPGNVVHLDWEINNFYVVLAKFTTPDGEALENATLQDSKQAVVTDKKGKLHGELRKVKTLTFITADDQGCETTMPEKEPVDGVLIYSEPLVCKPITLLN